VDPICHTLTGAALGFTGAGEARFGRATLIIGANLPDIDALTCLADGVVWLGIRGGGTHGIRPTTKTVCERCLGFASGRWDRSHLCSSFLRIIETPRRNYLTHSYHATANIDGIAVVLHPRRLRHTGRVLMNSALSFAMSIGPISLLVALLAIPIYYVSYRSALEPKKDVSLTRYAGMSLLAGTVAFIVGTILGVWIACSPADAGNLCGLSGFFGVGPLLSAAAILYYVHSWRRDALR
jgi:hypothetical protein